MFDRSHSPTMGYPNFPERRADTPGSRTARTGNARHRRDARSVESFAGADRSHARDAEPPEVALDVGKGTRLTGRRALDNATGNRLVSICRPAARGDHGGGRTSRLPGPVFELVRARGLRMPTDTLSPADSNRADRRTSRPTPGDVIAFSFELREYLTHLREFLDRQREFLDSLRTTKSV